MLTGNVQLHFIVVHAHSYSYYCRHAMALSMYLVFHLSSPASEQPGPTFFRLEHARNLHLPACTWCISTITAGVLGWRSNGGRFSTNIHQRAAIFATPQGAQGGLSRAPDPTEKGTRQESAQGEGLGRGGAHVPVLRRRQRWVYSMMLRYCAMTASTTLQWRQQQCFECFIFSCADSMTFYR